MQFKLIADANIDSSLISSLREHDIQVISVHEDHRGVSEQNVLSLSVKNDALLLTEDKDFGEWIFAHGAENSGVIFIRYHQSNRKEMNETLVKVIMDERESLYNKFTTISPGKIRMRDIRS